MDLIKHQLYAALLGQYALFLSINCFGQVVQHSIIRMAPKRSKNRKTVLGKSKLKILAYKPEVQQFETCQTSHVGHVPICQNFRLHFRCNLRFLKAIFKTTNKLFENAKFRNFVKNRNFSKFQNDLLFS